MLCTVYARVSTDKQAEKELSIPAQLAAMRQYAIDRGWQIVQEFTEAGVSARTVDRPTLRQLLARCTETGLPKVDVVLVHKLDRLARNLADHVAIRSKLRTHGVALASVSESIEDSVSGQLVEHILASMAEFYSANLSEEVKKGMRQKVLQGGWPHQVPRGCRLLRLGDKSRVTIDEAQAALVRMAFEICATDFKGLVDLRCRLAALGLRSRSGEALSNGELSRLLRNPFYCGRMRWNGQIYSGGHPALIEPEVFDRVQQVLEDRTRRLVRTDRTKSPFPLSGVGTCAKCGSLLGSDIHRRWSYYRCRRSFRALGRCRARYCNVERVHKALEEVVRQTTIPCAVADDIIARTAIEEERRKWLRLVINQTKSAWEVFVALPVPSQRVLLRSLFKELVVDATGIVRYKRATTLAA